MIWRDWDSYKVGDSITLPVLYASRALPNQAAFEIPF
jgi:hypothetical protein